MAENVSKAWAVAVPVKNKERTVAVARKGLRVINGDINSRKRNINTVQQNVKTQKQENVPHLPGAEKFEIFEDTASESKDDKIQDDDEISGCSSSPECVIIKDFFCNVHKEKEKIRSDFIWITPYRQEIYAYLKEREQSVRPNPKYMDKQTGISMSMRSILVDWLVEVSEEYKMESETLHLAVNYVDRFLSNTFVSREKLQLIGTTSMCLASKYEEIHPPPLKDFVCITDDTFTTKQILRMEQLILKTLNCDISVPTAYTFLQLYCSMCNASESVIYLSQYICELSLVYGDPFLKFRPSMIAAGSIALANYTHGFNMWGEDIAETSEYQLTDLMHVILCLYNTYSSARESAYQGVHDKYQKNRFGRIANINPPQKLIFPNKSSKKCYL